MLCPWNTRPWLDLWWGGTDSCVCVIIVLESLHSSFPSFLLSLFLLLYVWDTQGALWKPRSPSLQLSPILKQDRVLPEYSSLETHPPLLLVSRLASLVPNVRFRHLSLLVGWKHQRNLIRRQPPTHCCHAVECFWHVRKINTSKWRIFTGEILWEI